MLGVDNIVTFLGQRLSGISADGESYGAPTNGSEYSGSNAVGINVQSQVMFHSLQCDHYGTGQVERNSFPFSFASSVEVSS